MLASAKSGVGIDEVLEAIVGASRRPRRPAAPLKAMLVDSWYDPYLGVVILVRVIDGAIRKGPQVEFMAAAPPTSSTASAASARRSSSSSELGAGEIGFITAQIKEVGETRVGDTITDARRPAAQALPGFKLVQPVVFCGLFPVDAADFEKLRDSLAKLRLNDASFSFEMETSAALGFGFRCGFLGLLHLEIIQERLTREYDLDLITTAPSRRLRSAPPRAADRRPGDPQPRRLARPQPDRGGRGAVDRGDDLHPRRISRRDPQAVPGPARHPEGPDLCRHRQPRPRQLRYELPLNEVVFDFYDRLKSISRGYASFDYHQLGHREGDLVKMSILVNAEPVDALSMIVHRANAEARGRGMCERLKDLIPRHLFKIPIQAAIGGKIIARETIAALRKDVTAKCYGGDATRKRKLLEKQKEGKTRMREYGNVSIPQEAFIAALRMGDERERFRQPISLSPRERAGARAPRPRLPLSRQRRLPRATLHNTASSGDSPRHDLQQLVQGPRRPGRAGQAKGARAI